MKMLKVFSAIFVGHLTFTMRNKKNSGEIPRSTVDLGLSTSPNQFPDLETIVT